MSAESSPEGRCTITFAGLPVDLYRQTAQHIDELRREFALIGASDAAAETVPARLQALIDDLQARFGPFPPNRRECCARPSPKVRQASTWCTECRPRPERRHWRSAPCSMRPMPSAGRANTS